MCSAGISVSTAFTLGSVSVSQKNSRRNYSRVYICFVNLENEVNSLIVTFFYCWQALLSNTPVSHIFGHETCKKRQTFCFSQNRSRTIRFSEIAIPVTPH